MHDGCSAVSASRATQSRTSWSRSESRSGRNLAAVERIEGGLLQDLSRDVDGLDPLPPVLIGRQIVETNRRVHARVGRDDLDRAAGVRVHRSDVNLVAVAPAGAEPS